MKKKKSADITTCETEMQMTPMIDVTFLLLIFFMCSIKFKYFDGKLGCYLPREGGVSAGEYEDTCERLEVRLSRPGAGSGRLHINLNGRRMAGLGQLFRSVQEVERKMPGQKLVCYVGEGIHHGEVVGVVNECLRAGINEVSFGGTPLDG